MLLRSFESPQGSLFAMIAKSRREIDFGEGQSLPVEDSLRYQHVDSLVSVHQFRNIHVTGHAD